MKRLSKRLFDVALSGTGLIFLSPLLLLVSAAVRLSSRGPILFRQERVGLNGRPFRILKFRSMAPDAEQTGPGVTRAGDPRITRVGRLLRKTKLDELPQLWNVFAGEMSLVGPRPELPKYVAKYTPSEQRVLALKPGITDAATLEFRNEEELLAGAPDTERFYLDCCVPRKIALNLEYAAQATLWTDAAIVLRTVLALTGLSRRRRRPREIPANGSDREPSVSDTP